MEHLSLETLARLVDELPTSTEREHLEACDACAAELDALRRQSEMLGRLPDLRPSPADFDAIEARLAAEGLVQVGSRAGYPELAITPSWMRRAAALASVEEAERDYVAALVEYRQMTAEPEIDGPAGDPAARYQALEYLVRAGQVAVRQAPADPFLNGLLASALAEQQAVSRRISSNSARQDGWF